MSGHTNGEWIRDGLSIYAFMHAGWKRGEEELKNRFYLRIYGDRECPEEEIEANARLIAAAPIQHAELLACKQFLEDMHTQTVEWTVAESQTRHVAVCAAIAAATGETK